MTEKQDQIDTEADDTCLIPGCGRGGNLRYPVNDGGRKLGYLCSVHGWQASIFKNHGGEGVNRGK